MSNKLTKAQHANLLFLANKAHVEICTSAGRALGKALFADGGEAKTIMSAINTFISWGYFDDEEKYYHGLRFSRLTINEKGKTALLDGELTDA